MVINMINELWIYISNDGIISLDLIGFLGPAICILISLYWLWGSPKYLIMYIIFTIIDRFTNKGLKRWIKQERPTDGKAILGEEYKGVELYGMPSGHLQSIFFSIIYLYLIKGSVKLLFVELVIALLAANQRISYRQHTVFQVIVGAICGICVAYLANYVAEYWIYEKDRW